MNTQELLGMGLILLLTLMGIAAEIFFILQIFKFGFTKELTLSLFIGPFLIWGLIKLIEYFI